MNQSAEIQTVSTTETASEPLATEGSVTVELVEFVGPGSETASELQVETYIDQTGEPLIPAPYEPPAPRPLITDYAGDILLDKITDNPVVFTAPVPEVPAPEATARSNPHTKSNLAYQIELSAQGKNA